MAYKEIWFRGLSKEDKESLERALGNSLLATKLKEILVMWEREIPVTKGDYDSPAWPYRQAHLNGMSEILTRLNTILNPDQR